MQMAISVNEALLYLVTFIYIKPEREVLNVIIYRRDISLIENIARLYRGSEVRRLLNLFFS